MASGNSGEGFVTIINDAKTGKRIESVDYEDAKKQGITSGMPTKQSDGTWKTDYTPTKLYEASPKASSPVGGSGKGGKKYTANWDDAKANNEIKATLDKKTGTVTVTAPKYVQDRAQWKEYEKQFQQMSEDYKKNPKGFYTDADGKKTSIEDMVKQTADDLNNKKMTYEDKDGNKVEGTMSFLESAYQFEQEKKAIEKTLGNHDDGNFNKTPVKLTDDQVNLFLTQAYTYTDSSGVLHRPKDNDKQLISEEVIKRTLGDDALKKMESYDEATHTATFADIQKYINTRKENGMGSDNADEDIQQMYSNAESIAKNENLDTNERLKALAFAQFLKNQKPDCEWYQSIGDWAYGIAVGADTAIDSTVQSAERTFTIVSGVARGEDYLNSEEFTDQLDKFREHQEAIDKFVDDNVLVKGPEFQYAVVAGGIVEAMAEAFILHKASGAVSRGLASVGSKVAGAAAEAADRAADKARAVEWLTKLANPAGLADNAALYGRVTQAVTALSELQKPISRVIVALGPERMAKVFSSLSNGIKAIDQGIKIADSGQRVGRTVEGLVKAGKITEEAADAIKFAARSRQALNFIREFAVDVIADNKDLVSDLLLARKNGDSDVKTLWDAVINEAAWNAKGAGAAFLLGRVGKAVTSTVGFKALNYNVSRVMAKFSQPFSDFNTALMNKIHVGRFSASAETTAETIEKMVGGKHPKNKRADAFKERASLREMKRAQGEDQRIKYFIKDETGDTLEERVSSAYNRQAETYMKYQNALDDLFAGNRRTTSKFEDANQEHNFAQEMDDVYDTQGDVARAESKAGEEFKVYRADAKTDIDITRKSTYIMSTLTTDRIAVSPQFKMMLRRTGLSDVERKTLETLLTTKGGKVQAAQLKSLLTKTKLTSEEIKSLQDMGDLIKEFNKKAPEELRKATEKHITALEKLGTQSENVWTDLGIRNKEELESLRKTGRFDDGWFHVQGEWSESEASAGHANPKNSQRATKVEAKTVYAGGMAEDDSYKLYRKGMHYENPILSFKTREQKMANIYNRRNMFEAFNGATGGAAVYVDAKGTEYVRKMDVKWEGKPLRKHIQETADNALAGAGEGLKTKFSDMMSSKYNETKTTLAYTKAQDKVETAERVLDEAKTVNYAQKTYDAPSKVSYIKYQFDLDDTQATTDATKNNLKAKSYSSYKRTNEMYDKLIKEHPEILTETQAQRGAAVKDYIDKNMRINGKRITRSKKAWESATRDPQFRKAVLYDHADLIEPTAGMKRYTTTMRRQMAINEKTAYYEQTLNDAAKYQNLMDATGKASKETLDKNISGFIDETLGTIKNDSGFKHTVEAVAEEFGVKADDTLADYLAEDFLLKGTASKEGERGAKTLDEIINDGLDTQLNDLIASRRAYYDDKIFKYRDSTKEAGGKIDKKKIKDLHDAREREVDHILRESDDWKQSIKDSIEGNLAGRRQTAIDMYTNAAPDLVDTENIYNEMNELKEKITGAKSEVQDIIAVPNELGQTQYIRVNPILAEIVNVRGIAQDPTELQKLIKLSNSAWRIGTSGPGAIRSFINQCFKDGINAFVGGGAVKTAKMYADSLSSTFGEDIAEYVKKYEPENFKQARKEAEELWEKTSASKNMPKRPARTNGTPLDDAIYELTTGASPREFLERSEIEKIIKEAGGTEEDVAKVVNRRIDQAAAMRLRGYEEMAPYTDPKKVKTLEGAAARTKQNIISDAKAGRSKPASLAYSAGVYGSSPEDMVDVATASQQAGAEYARASFKVDDAEAAKQAWIDKKTIDLLSKREAGSMSESYFRASEETYASYLNDEYRTAAGDVKTTLDKANQKIDDWVQKMDFMNDKMREQPLRRATYAAGFQEGLSRNMSVKNAREYAEFIMSNATTNFNRRSAFADTFQSATPYLNSAVNGNRSFARLASMDPLGVFARLTCIVLPLASMTARAMSEEKNRVAWENLNEYDKDGNIVLFDGNGNVVTVPVPDEMAPLFTFVQSGVANLYGANRKAFWELEFNSLLNAAPVDLSGFTQDDAQNLLSDSDWPNKIDVKSGISKLSYNLLPAAGKVAVRSMSGIDPYTGKPLDNTFVKYDPETGEYVEAGDYAAEYAKDFARLFGKNEQGKYNVSAPMVESIMEGIVGTGVSEMFDSLYKLGKAVKTGDSELANSAPEGFIDYATGSLNTQVYSQADRAWNKAVSEMYEEKNRLMTDDSFKKAVSDYFNATNEKDKQKHYNAISDKTDAFYDKVIKMSNNLIKQYPDNFTASKYAAVINLCNFGSTLSLPPTGSDYYDAYTSEMNKDLKNQGKRMAIDSLVNKGFSANPNDTSIFGQIRYNPDTEETYVQYSTPMSILQKENTINDYKNQDIHIQNLTSIFKSNLPEGQSSIYSYRKEYYNGLLKKGVKKKTARNEWNARVIEMIAPYVEKYGLDNILTPEVSDYLDGIMYVDVYSGTTKIKKAFEKEGIK